MSVQHIIAEDGSDIGDQVLEAIRFEKVESFGVDSGNADPRRTGMNPTAILSQERFDIGHSLGAPVIEKRLHSAEIFDPHGDRRKIKDIGL